MTEHNHKPVLIVIAGPNGSGKTTITSKILHHEWLENAIYINPDIIAQEKFGSWNDQEAVMKSVRYCEQLREDCLVQKRSLIFETVLSIQQKIDYIKRAKEADCRIASKLVDRTYIYDNSIENAEAQLLFRMVEGKLYKQYSKTIPEWAQTILQ